MATFQFFRFFSPQIYLIVLHPCCQILDSHEEICEAVAIKVNQCHGVRNCQTFVLNGRIDTFFFWVFNQHCAFKSRCQKSNTVLNRLRRQLQCNHDLARNARLCINNVIKPVTIDIGNKGLWISFYFLRPGSRFECRLVLQCDLVLDKHSVNYFDHCATELSRTCHEQTHLQTWTAYRYITDIWAAIDGEIFPGGKHFSQSVVNMDENLITAIYSDHIRVFVRIHVCKSL